MNKKMVVRNVVFAGVVAAAGVVQAKPGATLAPAADLKWTDVPGFPGVHMAAAEGDPGKGASHFFLKFDKGFAAPDHHHSADHYGTVVAGTLVLTIDGKETKLPAGSYFSFTGKKPHSTKCDAAADCILQIDARGKWDVVPEKKAADAKKPAK
jgi:quercetin dioxygenase-like cupin family protein